MMQKLVEATAQAAQTKYHNDAVKLYTDLLTATYDKSAAYVNVVTLGGYAAFFALWSLLGSQLSSSQKLWAGLFLGVSVLFFVGFEVAKMAILHWQLWWMKKVIGANQEALSDQVRNYHSSAAVTSRIAAGLWLFVFPVTIFTGVAGASVLLYAFALKIINGT